MKTVYCGRVYTFKKLCEDGEGGGDGGVAPNSSGAYPNEPGLEGTYPGIGTVSRSGPVKKKKFKTIEKQLKKAMGVE